MAASGHFECPKITFDLISGHFRSIQISLSPQQEPGANGTEILNSLKYVRPGNGFVPNFRLTEKVNVNGEDEHPMFTYMKVSRQRWTSYVYVVKC